MPAWTAAPLPACGRRNSSTLIEPATASCFAANNGRGVVRAAVIDDEDVDLTHLRRGPGTGSAGARAVQVREQLVECGPYALLLVVCGQNESYGALWLRQFVRRVGSYGRLVTRRWGGRHSRHGSRQRRSGASTRLRASRDHPATEREGR